MTCHFEFTALGKDILLPKQFQRVGVAFEEVNHGDFDLTFGSEKTYRSGESNVKNLNFDIREAFGQDAWGVGTFGNPDVESHVVEARVPRNAKRAQFLYLGLKSTQVFNRFAIGNIAVRLRKAGIRAKQ